MPTAYFLYISRVGYTQRGGGVIASLYSAFGGTLFLDGSRAAEKSSDGLDEYWSTSSFLSAVFSDIVPGKKCAEQQ